MGSKILKTAKRTVKLDARADRADIRDRIYQPPLVSLPAEFPSKERIANYLPAYRKAGLVLDQLGEQPVGAGVGAGDEHDRVRRRASRTLSTSCVRDASRCRRLSSGRHGPARSGGSATGPSPTCSPSTSPTGR